MSGDGSPKRELEPLDEIILGEESDALPAQRSPSSPPWRRTIPPEVPAAGERSVAPPPRKERGSTAPASAAAPAGKRSRDPESRKRGRMTLRIPDDEVSRPSLPTTAMPAGGAVALGAVTPSRPPSALDEEERLSRDEPEDDDISADETLELPAEKVRARLAALTGDEGGPKSIPPAFGIDATDDPGWTPYQPEVEEAFAMAAQIQPTPIIELGGNGQTVLDGYEVENLAPPAASPPPDSVSDEIPVDMDLSGLPDPSSDDLATTPRLPVDVEAIPSDDVERISGEVEVGPEDLVSVETLPGSDLVPPEVPAPAAPPPVRTTGKHPVARAPEPAPAAPPIPSGPPPPPAPAVVQAPAPAAPPPPPAPVGAAAGAVPRPGSAPQLVFVPPVGGLAPPPMTDTAASRKKARPWWEELFNDDFIRTMAKVTDAQIGTEVDFIEESLGCEAGAMILDLACGTGRHAVELATRGYQVVGFDLSLAMLARASDEAQDRNQKINFVQGDMREMTFEETFDGVFSWNTSFGYFDEEKNGAVIARVHKALKKGGQFLLDVVNRDYVIRQAPSLAWFEGDGCICMDEMTVDFITSRMRVKRTLMMDDGRTKEIEYSVRLYALHELGKMLHDNGFRVAEVSGRTGTPGVFFGCESPRTLILAEKR